jgi:hypothetical protein
MATATTTLPLPAPFYGGNAPVSLSKNLMTGPKFTQCMRDDINRQFEMIYMFRQEPEVHAMLLFCFYDQVQTEVHSSVRQHSAQNEQYKKYIAPIYEAYNKHEAALVGQITATLMPLIKPANQTISSKFPVVFDNAGNNLAAIVMQMQTDYPTSTSIFVSDKLKQQFEKKDQALPKSDINSIQFVQMFGKLLRRIIMQNMPYAVEIARATYVFTRVQALLALSTTGSLSPDDKRLLQLLLDSKVIYYTSLTQFPVTVDKLRADRVNLDFSTKLLRQHVVCHALYSCQPHTTGASAVLDINATAIANSGEEIVSFVNNELANSAVSLGTLPLLFVWPLLERCLQDAGVFIQFSGQEMASNDNLMGYVRRTLRCPSNALAGQIAAGSHFKFLQNSWPPDFSIMGSDSALPLTLKDDLGHESTQHLLGRKMAAQYSHFTHTGLLHLCREASRAIAAGYSQCKMYEEVVKMLALEPRIATLTHLMESPACRYMDRNDYFACTDECLHLHASGVEMNHVSVSPRRVPSPSHSPTPTSTPATAPHVMQAEGAVVVAAATTTGLPHKWKQQQQRRTPPPPVIFYEQGKEDGIFPCKILPPQVEKHTANLQTSIRMLNNDRFARNLPLLVVIEQPAEAAVADEGEEEESSSAAEPPKVNKRKRKREDDNSSVSGDSSSVHENGGDEEVKKTAVPTTSRPKRTKVANAAKETTVTATVKTRASRRKGR